MHKVYPVFHPPQLVRNVVNVSYHVSKYKVIVDELHKEITELKDKLAKQAPGNSGFDRAEAARLVEWFIQELSY